jgi:hypothetical protein
MLVPAAQAFAFGTLKVTIAGTGSGEVTSVGGYEETGLYEGAPPIACSGPPATGTCETELEEFEEVEPGYQAIVFHTKAAPGSEFIKAEATQGRIGECFAGEGCRIASAATPGGNVEVTVYFGPPPPKYLLTVEKTGTGSGTVTSSPSGINCGVTCSAEFKEGTSVTLSGTPAEGSVLMDWQVAGCSGGGNCQVTMSEARNATPVFCLVGEAYVGGECVSNLKLNIEEGSGTVVSNPAGLECTGSTPHSCEAAVAEGAVTLTASPAPGYLVKSWKGCDTGGVNGRQCTVTATGSLKSVGVKFYKVFSLQGSKSGGLGIMGTTPGGINCGYACSSSTALYKEAALTVKAKPAKHFHFVEFTGGTGAAESCNGVTSLECTIASFNSNSAIEELYAEDAKSTLSLAKTGGGQGFVKTKPTNVNCGYTCTSAEASFFASEEPEVTVTLGKGTTSVTWTSGAGTCTGNAVTCTVPMSSSHELVAKFE